MKFLIEFLVDTERDVYSDTLQSLLYISALNEAVRKQSEFWSFFSHGLSTGFGSINDHLSSGEDTAHWALQRDDTELTPASRLHHCSLTFQLHPPDTQRSTGQECYFCGVSCTHCFTMTFIKHITYCTDDRMTFRWIITWHWHSHVFHMCILLPVAIFPHNLIIFMTCNDFLRHFPTWFIHQHMVYWWYFHNVLTQLIYFHMWFWHMIQFKSSFFTCKACGYYFFYTLFPEGVWRQIPN